MINIRFLARVFGVALLLPLSALADDLKPFTTDGCSSFPDGTIEQASLWENCCISHDFAYWQGGTFEERLVADEELESCVAGVGEPTIASLMLAGVRVGGTPYLPTSYRWGYGWPFMRGYKPLTVEEKLEVRKELELFQKTDNSNAEKIEKHKQ
jgi:hypothetical protein